MAKRKKKSAGPASTPAAVDDRTATDSAVRSGDEIGAGPHRGRVMPASDGQGELVDGTWDPDTGEFEPLAADADVDGAPHPLTPSPPRPVTIISVPQGPPIAPGEEGTCPRHVDVQLRNARQRATMRRVFTGLDLAGERTLDGKRVGNHAQAVLWLLEQIDCSVQDVEL